MKQLFFCARLIILNVFNDEYRFIYSLQNACINVIHSKYIMYYQKTVNMLLIPEIFHHFSQYSMLETLLMNLLVGFGFPNIFTLTRRFFQIDANPMIEIWNGERLARLLHFCNTIKPSFITIFPNYFSNVFRPYFEISASHRKYSWIGQTWTTLLITCRHSH